jgi:hypothetical protein
VSLALTNCARLDETSVRRIFAADLGTRVATEANPYITEVQITCEGARVIVRVRDPLSRKHVKRSFDSTSFGDRGEARLIAIAASELVMASWAELAAIPAPAVEPEGPAPTAQTIETARAAVRAHRAPPRNLDSTALPPVAGSAANQPKSAAPSDAAGAPEREEDPALGFAPERTTPARRNDRDRLDEPVLRIVALASMRTFFGGAGELWGGGARIGEERFKIASWAIDALVESGTLDGTEVTSTTVGGHLQTFVSHRVLTWRLGVGLRAGLLASQGGPYVGTFGWPLATTSLSIFFVKGLTLDLGGEFGYGILPVSGSARPAVRGWWASGQFGAGLTF